MDCAVCHECGAPRGGTHRRGALLVQSDPPAAYWRGVSIRLTPRQIAILGLLADRGDASHLALMLVGTGEDTNPEQIKVAISNLRRRLPEGLTIETIRGWGYGVRISHE
jgi:DNA-binding response OmpR family regulator